ncbi:MAG: hypothetical protein KAX34_07640, partial [Aeromonas sp.]|nr:hypothetical protein [Aeromonas sp.]
SVLIISTSASLGIDLLGTILLYEKNSGLMQVKLLCFSAWQRWFLLQPPHSLDENAVIIAIHQ